MEQRIGLSDIVALELKCKYCPETIILEPAKMFADSVPQICPNENCKKPWIHEPGVPTSVEHVPTTEYSIRELVNRVIGSMHVLWERMKGPHPDPAQFPGGFTVKLVVETPETKAATP